MTEDPRTTAVRERYGATARAIAAEPTAACCDATPTGAACCGPTPAGASCCGAPTATRTSAFGGSLYAPGDVHDAAAPAVAASLGCGVPTAVADLRPGDVVLDLGCGAGGDVLLSARRVGLTGRVYGLDMTDDMLALAQRNVEEAGATNVVLLKGSIEDVPLPSASVDVVISNCVINLAVDKDVVLREAARVLRPGGRFAVSDVIADDDMPADVRADMDAFTGCIAGALTRDAFAAALRRAGFADVVIDETHRVHAHASAAIVRATAGTGA